MPTPYDPGHAALAVFTEGLANQLRGSGVLVSIFCPGSKGPRIGQNTRSRGVGRLFRGADSGPDTSTQLDRLACAMVDGLHHRRFLILCDPSDAPAFRGRGDHVDAGPLTP